MYQPGEVAGFDDDMAAAIISSGFAVVDGEEDAKPVAEGENQLPVQGAARGRRGKAKADPLPVQGAETVAGEGDDTLAGADADTVAGEGDDTLAGADADTVAGEGDDTLAGADADTVAGEGDDTLAGA